MPKSSPMSESQLKSSVLEALDDIKARDALAHNVGGLTDITDVMIIATGTSDTHVRACANSVIDSLKEKGEYPIHVEGLESRPFDWVLVDYGAVVVHVMREDTRQFYDLDSFWGGTFERVEQGRDQVGEE